MDIMIIKSKLILATLKRVLKRIIKNNFGIDVDINFNDGITIEHNEKGAHVHLNVDLYADQVEMEKLLEKL